MLSKIDILNELGKGIVVFPLDANNIKENSLNLCAGQFAWTTESATIYCCDEENDKDKRFSLEKDDVHNIEIKLEKGRSCTVLDKKNNKYIILLPLTTTLIETKEVLSLSSNIGGTYHSKVGQVSKGLGHIGTMVGPNFSGDSLIAIHNVTKNMIILKEGESFVSVVFHYLDTPYTQLNPTTSGHTDKFAALGIKATEEELIILNQDWKKSFLEVCKKMCASDEFNRIKKELAEEKKKRFKKWFNKKNILIVVFTVCVFTGLYFIACAVDKAAENTIWVDRFFNVGFSGIFIFIFSFVSKLLKNNSR